MSRSKLPEPVAGTSPSVTEKTRIMRIAKAKLGMDTPPSEKSITAASIGELRLTAAITPSDMPRTMERSIAAPASSSVLGRRSRMSFVTAWCWMYDCPRSPRTAFPSQRTYWIASGSFNPRSSRICSARAIRCSGVPTPKAAAPIIASTGSPGMRCRIAKTRSDASNTTGIASTNRCAMNFATGLTLGGRGARPPDWIVADVEPFVPQQSDRALDERRDLCQRRVHALDLRQRPDRPVGGLRVHRCLAKEAREQRLDLRRQEEVDERARLGGMLRPGEERDRVGLDVRPHPAVLVEPRLAHGVALQIEDMDVRRIRDGDRLALAGERLARPKVRCVDAHAVREESVDEPGRPGVALHDAERGELRHRGHLDERGARDGAAKARVREVLEPRGPGGGVRQHRAVHHGGARPGGEREPRMVRRAQPVGVRLRDRRRVRLEHAGLANELECELAVREQQVGLRIRALR